MKEPIKILQELSDKSLKEDLTISEWLEYLQDLRSEVESCIQIAQADLDREKSRK